MTERRVNNEVNRVEMKTIATRNFYAVGTTTKTVVTNGEKSKKTVSVIKTFDNVTNLQAKRAAKAWAKAEKVALEGVHAAG